MTWTLLFFGFTVALFLLPLAPALLEWRNRRDAQPLKVVRDYDGNIKHFAIRFRQFLSQQFAELAHDSGPAPVARVGRLPTGDQYELVGADGLPNIADEERAQQDVHHMVLGTADLRLGSDMLYEKEVFAAGAIISGGGNSFRALLAKGDIMLGPDSDVLRWAHSDGSISAGAKCRLFGRISADRALLLRGETRFGRMRAPTIRWGDTQPPPLPQPAARTPLERPRELLDESAGRWLAPGDWVLPDASYHRGDLVARGAMAVGAGSLIEGSIKSHGELRLEAGTRITGAVVCSERIWIGPGCVIGGPLICERSIEIGAGTVLGTPDTETTVTAEEIRVHEGVIAHGTVWARELGFVIPAVATTTGASA